MPRSRVPPTVFKQFLEQVNGEGVTLTSGIHRDLSGRPILRIGMMAGANTGRGIKVCLDIADNPVGLFDINESARGGTPCVTVALPDGRLPIRIPNAAKPDDTPWVILSAARHWFVDKQGHCFLAQLCRCIMCGRFFWSKTQRRSLCCSDTCRVHRATALKPTTLAGRMAKKKRGLGTLPQAPSV